MTNLSRLCCQVHNAAANRIHATRSSLSILTFSALHTLSLAAGSLAPITTLLRHCRFPVVHVIFVRLIIGDDDRAAPNLMSFFTAVQEYCSCNSLNKLGLLVFPNESNRVPLGNLLWYNITFGLLRPLTIFGNITSIRLEAPFGANLNEQELLYLASSWPHLETFEMGQRVGWARSSAITPGGFLQLLESCRSLQGLYIMLDTRGYTEIPRGHPWRGLRMPKSTHIHLVNSPIEEASVEALAIFFHVAPYPDFHLKTTWDLRWDQSREQYLYRDRWNRVRSLAHNLWKERKALRCSVEIRLLQCPP